MRFNFIIILIFMLIDPAFALDKNFIEAANFAITGSDKNSLKIIDRENCVFKYKSDVYYLNNVQIDRIKIYSFKTSLDSYSKVELHGSQKIAISTIDALIDDGSELNNILKQSNPNLYQSHNIELFDISINVATTDQSRLIRAWEYIYQNGCSGKYSSF